MTQELVILNNEELMYIDGGFDAESAANTAWIVGSIASQTANPVGAAVAIICWCYAGGYYLGKTIVG